MEPSNSPTYSIEQLRHVALHFPIIDNHAHNLILPTHADTIPFETITSEAQGRALRDTFKSLAHLRAARQLRELYQLDENASWTEILEQREEWLHSDHERLNQRCFEGVTALLIDDGLAEPGKVHPYDWHDRYTDAPSKRIVRIETVAERLMEDIVKDSDEDDLGKAHFYTKTWTTFMDDFERKIQDSIDDREVVGFKSVICYRTGLDVEEDYERAAKAVGYPFERYVKSCVRKRSFRIERKALNDYLVLRTLEILSDHVGRSDDFSKPLQLHTGLGDNDIDLSLSNPAFLQPLIENYPNVPFVILHSAYPYTREAGYLATVYKHVYLDIGEVFPMVSRDGQKAILRQALELVPGSKLLYSSDGHWFPETFWLANKQFREVWLELLIEYVEKTDLTTNQAIGMTRDILFNNSNALYKLRYEALFTDIPPEPPKQLTFNPKSVEEPQPRPQSQIQPPITPIPMPSPPRRSTASRSDSQISPGQRSASPYEPPPGPPPGFSQLYDVALFDDFRRQNPSVNFVYVQWLDYMATMRVRVLPIKEFTRIIYEGQRIGIAQGNTGTLQNDALTPVVNTTGQIYVEPDLRSLCRAHDKDPLKAATVMSYWRSEDGRPLPSCPRNNLDSLVRELQEKYNTTLQVGFEIEVTFLSHDKPINPFNSEQKQSTYAPVTDVHAWSTLTPTQWLQTTMLGEIATSLATMGIDLQQFHAESGPGQYEFILPPAPPLLAIDTLLQTRQVIAQIAALHGARATLHPKPFGAKGAGSAAHAHISLQPPARDKDFFVGGVLKHLPALCAFTMPDAQSYGRVADDQWSGGSWVAWGTQNRECPLRRVEEGRWEVRCLDGLANMYFVIAGVVAAGMLGLSSVSAAPPVPGPVYDQAGPGAAEHGGVGLAEGEDRLRQSGSEAAYKEMDLPVNPSTLDDEGRARYGITRKMPKSFDEAYSALRADGQLKEALGSGLVRDYLTMKDYEQEMLDKMDEAKRREWLIERY
ncbi:hypothetical protein C7974DRAFT_389857 [Boeremia exigua]|uniref:uncharacterized protein n=1 Tax=Boeremia exigua TaxID=749465 RepID=UPI001E8E97CB|nr:uncharacterized protein C7974DRAFT_389857 [Boeremia exigua]KAH6637610.1 hypothetical protein C7974DRAFT_389857 [Boeremia exigua]